MLTPEERAHEEEKARIQTEAQWNKGVAFVKSQYKLVGYGCLAIVALLVVAALLSSL